MRKKTSLWLSVGVAAFLINSVVFAATTVTTDYYVIKPFLLGLVTVQPAFKIEGVTFSFNQTSLIYEKAVVYLYALASKTASISVTLYDVGNKIIAEGSVFTEKLNAGQTQTFNVGLTWVANRTIYDFSVGKVVVIEI